MTYNVQRTINHSYYAQSYLWRTGYGDGSNEESGSRPIILAGNKSDLERSRVVAQEGK